MANSLQDQLLKAGLVSRNQLQDSRQQAKRKRKRSGGKPAPEPVVSAADKRRIEQQKKDKRLNAEREKQRKNQELRLRIRELVLSSSLNVATAELCYNLVRDGRIRRVYVTEQQRQQLEQRAIGGDDRQGSQPYCCSGCGRKNSRPDAWLLCLPEYRSGNGRRD